MTEAKTLDVPKMDELPEEIDKLADAIFDMNEARGALTEFLGRRKRIGRLGMTAEMEDGYHENFTVEGAPMELILDHIEKDLTKKYDDAFGFYRTAVARAAEVMKVVEGVK